MYKAVKSYVLLAASCDTICDSALFHMTAYEIYANSAHGPVCELLMDAHDIFANSAHLICANRK